VVKNYLRTTFDKLGLWTRLELALYVASHGGSTWHLQLGLCAQTEDEAQTVDAAVEFASRASVPVLGGHL
jgi:hypothetical protein